MSAQSSTQSSSDAANKARVLWALSAHCGEQNGIGARELSRLTGVSERDLRIAVTELRMEGTAVCGHPGVGYFIAATPEELERTCSFLHSRAMSSLTLEAKMRHVPLPELLGQLRLPT